MSASGSGAPPPSPLMAGGQPISETTANAAADWLTLFMSGEASAQDQQRWREWRSADPEHERAWQHIETVTGKLKTVEPHAAYHALSSYNELEAAGPPPRRKLLGLLLFCGLAGSAGLLVPRSQAWRTLAADYRTGIGRLRTEVLDDGSRITLNTGTAIDVRFDAGERRIRLIAGELAIVTGHRDHAHPERRRFVVETAEGSIRALGTRFSVRQREGRTEVAVVESAVEITPGAAPARAYVVAAGRQTAFTRDAPGAQDVLDKSALAWTKGQIVADNMRLADFVAELGRYREGSMHCSAAVADLRLSGVFPLTDIEQILATLPRALPVQVRHTTAYLVTIDAR
jgi:transmembrane sensor